MRAAGVPSCSCLSPPSAGRRADFWFESCRSRMHGRSCSGARCSCRCSSPSSSWRCTGARCRARSRRGLSRRAGRAAACRHVFLFHRLGDPHDGCHVRADERVAAARRAGRLVVLRERVPARTGSRWRSRSQASSSCSAVRSMRARIKGNLMALGVSVCYVAQLTVLRKFHASVDMLPMVMIAGLWSIARVAARRSLHGNKARSRRPRLHGLRSSAWAPCSRPPPRAHCRPANWDCSIAGTDPRSALGVGAARRASGYHCTRRRRVRAVRGYRQRGHRRATRTRRRRAAPLPGP